jgi:hypothetical protein
VVGIAQSESWLQRTVQQAQAEFVASKLERVKTARLQIFSWKQEICAGILVRASLRTSKGSCLRDAIHKRFAQFGGALASTHGLNHQQAGVASRPEECEDPGGARAEEVRRDLYRQNGVPRFHAHKIRRRPCRIQSAAEDSAISGKFPWGRCLASEKQVM